MFIVATADPAELVRPHCTWHASDEKPWTRTVDCQFPGRAGRAEAALAHHRRALAIARRLHSPAAVRTVLLGLGETSLRIGRPAEDDFRQALRLARDARYPMHEALALDGLAHATGEIAYWRGALAIFTELGVGQADLVRQHLADPSGRWCDLCPATAPVTVAVAEPVGVR